MQPDYGGRELPCKGNTQGIQMGIDFSSVFILPVNHFNPRIFAPQFQKK
jgi:hypothetical protein